MQSTRIFVDFWNLQLSIIENAGSRYRLDWKAVSPFLVQEASKLVGTQLQFQETSVYLSFNPRAATDKSLHQWATNTLDRFPGIRVFATERKPRGAPTCPNCHQPVTTCPHCAGSMVGTIEKVGDYPQV